MTKIVQWLKTTTCNVASGWCSFMRAIHIDYDPSSKGRGGTRGRTVTPLID